MQAIPIGLAVAGSIAKGIGGYKAGKQNKKALYAAAIEEEKAGNAQALAVRDTARAKIGQQISGQFGNGFQGGSGSALDALTESQVNATLDMLEVRRQALTKARSQRAEGDMRMSQGKFALAEGLIGAGSAAVSMGSDWGAAKAPS